MFARTITLASLPNAKSLRLAILVIVDIHSQPCLKKLILLVQIARSAPTPSDRYRAAGPDEKILVSININDTSGSPEHGCAQGCLFCLEKWTLGFLLLQ